MDCKDLFGSPCIFYKDIYVMKNISRYQSTGCPNENRAFVMNTVQNLKISYVILKHDFKYCFCLM